MLKVVVALALLRVRFIWTRWGSSQLDPRMSPERFAVWLSFEISPVTENHATIALWCHFICLRHIFRVPWKPAVQQDVTCADHGTWHDRRRWNFTPWCAVTLPIFGSTILGPHESVTLIFFVYVVTWQHCCLILLFVYCISSNSATSAFSLCLANIVNKVIFQVEENRPLENKSL